MLGDSDKERSYHSQERKRSISREQARKFKLEKVKMRFKNIASRIREIKNENTSDLTQLTSLMRGSEQIEKMAHQSLEKATLFLSESKLQKKRVTSPNFHDVKHANPHVQEFNQSPTQDHPNTPSARTDSLPKRKTKAGKRSVAPSHIKTDETSESEVFRECHIQKISEIQLQQQYSGIRQESAQDVSQQVPQDNIQQEIQKEVPTTIQIEPSKELRQSTSNRSLLKSGSRSASTQGSLRTSLRRNLNPPQHKRKGQSIYPYIAIILFSIIFLVVLRG